nr:DUF4430 domain-containing protein [uncultured Solibaculum sp.]
MKRLLCFVVTLGCVVGLMSGCGQVPAEQNGSALSSEEVSSQGGSSLPDQSALSSSAQSSQEDSSGGEEPSPSSQKQEGANPATSKKETSTSHSSSVSKSQGQAAGGKNTVSSPAASEPSNTPAPPATTPDVPSQGGNSGSQEEPKEDPDTITITLSVECRAAREKGNEIAQKISDENGYIRTPVTMQLQKDATAYDALKQTGLVIVSEEGMFGQYVKSIQSLNRGVLGRESGWKYEVNGVYPGISCSKYTLSDGDIVIWRYSLTA